MVIGVEAEGSQPSCPACGSLRTSRDVPHFFLCLGMLLLFPFGLMLLWFNRNRWCRACGVRFKVG